MSGRLIIVFLFASIISDFITSSAAGWKILQVQRKSLGMYVAILVFANALEAAIVLFRITVWPLQPSCTPVHGVLPGIIGRTVKSAASTLLILWVLGYVNGPYAPKLPKPE